MVSSFLQLVAQKYELDEQGRKWIGFAVDGAARMKKLIEDLLVFSRAGRDTEQAPVDLGKMAGFAQANLAERIQGYAAEVTCGPLPVVLGNEVELIQVFQNLISNALKYRRADVRPIIRIGLAEKNDAVFVTDNGQGIPPELLERIFEPFYRLDNKEQGSGIGLAVCRRIVEARGGKIWGESVEGQGSTLFFILKGLVDADNQAD